jgi:hypothetical protein
VIDFVKVPLYSTVDGEKVKLKFYEQVLRNSFFHFGSDKEENWLLTKESARLDILQFMQTRGYIIDQDVMRCALEGLGKLTVSFVFFLPHGFMSLPDSHLNR